MRDAFSLALGDPGKFLDDIPALASKFNGFAGEPGTDVSRIRKFIELRNYVLSDDPDILRSTLAAFCLLLTERYGQHLRLKGIFRKRIVVESRSFCCDLIDLFYRCMFEGLEFDAACAS